MTNSQQKKTHRKVSCLVGISTTLFSICGPLLQTVAIAETQSADTPSVKLPHLVTVNSVINYDTEFSSNLDTSVEEEVSSSSPEASSESSELPVEESSTSSTTDSTTQSSSSTSSDSSTSHTTSSSSSTSGSNSNSHNLKPGTSSSSSSSHTNGGSSTSSSSSSKLDQKDSSSSKDNTPIVYSRNQSTAEFIEEIGEDARKIGQENDLYASVMIAQAILESASGNSSLARTPNYNLFGIKGSFQGDSVKMATLEDNGSGSMYTISASFRKYPSYKESLQDYATLMTGGTLGRSTFYQGAWKSNTDSYKDATQYLTGRYATDTRYNEKLNGLIETYDLTQYDHKVAIEDKMEKSKETEAFISEIAKDAKEISEKNDVYASVLIAEAIINSSSGNNVLAKNHNLFLTEGEYEEQSVEVETLQKQGKETTLETVAYKVYPSYKVSMEDQLAELKKTEDVYNEMTTAKKDTYKKVTAYLTAQKQEDMKYHKKLNALIATYDLTQYDKKVEVKKEVDNLKTTKKTENLDILTTIGQNMTDKLFEGLDQPIKYQVTNK